MEGVDLATQLFGEKYNGLMSEEGDMLDIKTYDLGIQHLEEDCSYLPKLSEWFDDCEEIKLNTRIISANKLSELSADKFGGVPEDYIKIHEFIDQFTDKNSWSRAILHHAFGIFIVEQKFGISFLRSNNKSFPTRIIAEFHMEKEFNNFIPTVETWCSSIKYNKMWQRTGAKNLSKEYID